MIGSGEFEVKALETKVMNTVFPKTKRFGSQSRQLRQNIKGRSQAPLMTTSSQSTPHIPCNVNCTQTQESAHNVNNNEDDIFQNENQVWPLPIPDVLNFVSHASNADSSQNVESSFEPVSPMSVVGSKETCVSCSESKRNANLLLHNHDNVCASIQKWKDIENNCPQSKLNDSTPINHNEHFVKTILIRKSRYENNSSPVSTSMSSSTTIIPPNNTKSVRFSPDTVFTERNPESSFWIKIEQERKRRRALRTHARDTGTILRFQKDKSGRILPRFKKQNASTDAVSSKKLIAILAGNSNLGVGRIESEQICLDKSLSPSPDRKCKHFWNGIKIRKSFSNVFVCFSPKPITTPTPRPAQ